MADILPAAPLGTTDQMSPTHAAVPTKVALWSSVVFGAVHLSNALTTGTSAIGQALVVSFAGYFFYLIRRVSRSNILNSVIHGLFDFTLISGTAILAKGEALYPGALLPMLVYVVCALLLLVRRHHIEPDAATQAL